MKNFLLLIFILSGFLYGEKLQVIAPHSYYSQSNIDEAYNKLLVLEETKELIKITNSMLNNKNFRDYLYLTEIGNTKVNTIYLIQNLNYFLRGWPKYTNTYFDNNSDIAGILKILQDSINNDYNFLNLSQQIINDMKNSIRDNKFFKIAKSIEFDLNHKNFKKIKNLKNILKNFDMLLLSFSNSILKINAPLLQEYNKKIKDKLIRKYRIYTNEPLSKAIKTLSMLINQNYKSTFDEKEF